MAVSWNPKAEVSRTGQGYSVDPLNVIVMPILSGRMDATDVTDLAKSIRANGQRQPALCWKNEEGWPVVAAGHRRLRAIIDTNRNVEDSQKLPLLFNYIPAKSEEEAFAYTIVENRDRLNPSPLDDANNMSILVHKFGKSDEQIARIYYPEINKPEEVAKAVREVKQTLQLLELSDEAKEELRKGFMSTSAAIQLSAIPSRKKQDEVIHNAKAKGKKRLKVEDAKAAKEEVVPVKQRKSISENTPVKMLKKFRILAEAAGGLAAECMSEEPDSEVTMDLSRSIVVMCKKLQIPLLPSADTYAERHKDKQTPLDTEE